MDGNGSRKRDPDKARLGNMAALRAVVGAYLIYLGVSLIRDYLGGRSTMSPWLAWGFGVFFALAGAAVICYTVLRRRAETAEKPQEEKKDAQSGD